jgi:hypothetical protein
MGYLLQLLARGLMTIARSGKIARLFKSKIMQEKAKDALEESGEWILKNMDKIGVVWTVGNVIVLVNAVFGIVDTYKIFKYIYDNMTDDLTPEMKKEFEKELKALEEKAIAEGYTPEKDLLNQKEKVTVDPTQTQTIGRGFNTNNEYTKVQTSYGGTDMLCSINIPGRGPIVFGELSNISYSIFREKVPVRALGRVSMKGYTRGMRNISGVLTFTVFDQSIVYQCMQELREQGYRMLMDEMPTFDVTISMANEFGSQSTMTLYGVSTYTEGSAMSIDSIITQNVYEFYALDIDPLTKITQQGDPYGSKRTAPSVPMAKWKNIYGADIVGEAKDPLTSNNPGRLL